MSIPCINAFIYAAKYRVFQQGVRRLITELAERLNQQQMQVDRPIEMGDTNGTRLQSSDMACAPSAELQEVRPTSDRV